MNGTNFYTRIHRLGRITVILALVCFMAVPFGLSAVYGQPLDFAAIVENGAPIFLTFAISGICENLSFMPIIGSGALYMACVTGNVSNMKIPAAVNAMEVAGYEPGTEKADVISIIAVAASTFVTTAIVFLGMLFLAPLFEPIYNNPFLQAGLRQHGARPVRRPALPLRGQGAQAGDPAHSPAHRGDLYRGQDLLLQLSELYYDDHHHFLRSVLLRAAQEGPDLTNDKLAWFKYPFLAILNRTSFVILLGRRHPTLQSGGGGTPRGTSMNIRRYELMKRIITLQDISCVGRCSITVALPVISAMGVECGILPTAVLSNHTMFKNFTCKDLSDQIEPISDVWEMEGITFDGIYTGYLASIEQCEQVCRFFDRFSTGDNLVLVDPAMADNGKLYAAFGPDFPEAMKKVCAKADVHRAQHHGGQPADRHALQDGIR